jgi:hypothetical protein
MGSEVNIVPKRQNTRICRRSAGGPWILLYKSYLMPLRDSLAAHHSLYCSLHSWIKIVAGWGNVGVPYEMLWECTRTCCSLLQNLSDFIRIEEEVLYLSPLNPPTPPPPPPTLSRRPPWPLVKRGLIDWYLDYFRYRTCVWCTINRKYQVRTSKYFRGDFSRLIAPPFLKRQGKLD